MGVSLLSSVASLAFGFVGTLAAPFLSLVTGAPVGGPGGASAAFVADLEAAVGEVHPSFHMGSFNSAVAEAGRAGRILLVYLHSEHHADSDAFCATTLANPEFAAYVDAHFVSWAGNIEAREPYQVAQALRAGSYPYMALVVPSPGSNNLVVIQVFQGFVEPENALQVFEMARAAHAQQAAAATQQADAAAAARAADRAIREEQDAAFQASLAADRAREAAAREAEAAAARAAEAEAAAAAERNAAAAERDAAIAALPEEPQAGVENTLSLLVRLPNGSRAQRRFLPSDPVGHLYAFVWSQGLEEELLQSGFTIVSNYPRTVYSDLSLSLSDAGIVDQMSLFLEPL